MKVSIIIPAYNAEKYIERCLKSLVDQTLSDIEIIVINDGSIDKTESICKEYSQNDSRIRVYTKDNEGQGLARNFGIKKATGEFIGFVDADDYVELNMYETLYNAASAYTADMVYSYMKDESYIEDSRFTKIDCGLLITSAGIADFKKMWFGALPEEKEDSILGMSVCRSIFKRNIIDENDIHFLSERIVNTEDLLFNIEFCQFCKCIVTVNQQFYTYRHDNPMSFALRPNPKRYMMFCSLHDKMSFLCVDDEERMRCDRRFLANCRVIMVEKARWCGINNYFITRKEIMSILMDGRLSVLLASYPIEKLPLMQRIYFYLMKKKSPLLLIILAKLRYRLI